MIHRSRTISVALWLLATAIPPASADNPGGDPARGGVLFRTKCFVCHSLTVDRVGPRLGGVVGRPAGRVPGYAFSSALAGAAIVLAEQSLDRWLAGPRRRIAAAGGGSATSSTGPIARNATTPSSTQAIQSANPTPL
jgi:cytochrome c2